MNYKVSKDTEQSKEADDRQCQEVGEALAAVWDKIKEGARRWLNENKQRLQELYTEENKPTLVGHVEMKETYVLKTDDDPECPRPLNRNRFSPWKRRNNWNKS